MSIKYEWLPLFLLFDISYFFTLMLCSKFPTTKKFSLWLFFALLKMLIIHCLHKNKMVHVFFKKKKSQFFLRFYFSSFSSTYSQDLEAKIRILYCFILLYLPLFFNVVNELVSLVFYSGRLLATWWMRDFFFLKHFQVIK